MDDGAGSGGDGVGGDVNVEGAEGSTGEEEIPLLDLAILLARGVFCVSSCTEFPFVLTGESSPLCDFPNSRVPLVLLVGVLDFSGEPISSQSEVRSFSFFHLNISEREGFLEGTVGRIVWEVGLSELLAKVGVDDPNLLLNHFRTPSRLVGSVFKRTEPGK